MVGNKKKLKISRGRIVTVQNQNSTTPTEASARGNGYVGLPALECSTPEHLRVEQGHR